MTVINEDVLERRAGVGEVLRKQRESIGLTKTEITREIGYRNVNLVARIETGESVIPIAKFPKFVEVYRMPDDMIKLVFQQLYPELFDFCMKVIDWCEEIAGNERQSLGQ